MRLAQFFIFGFFSLWCAVSTCAQPDTEIGKYLLAGNKLFEQGEYQKALEKYEEVIEKQPTNIYVIAKMARAEEELLYARISKEENPVAECREYIGKYSDEGKYILNVKNRLGQLFLANAYTAYQNQDIAQLENIYVEYLVLLGTSGSNEMKQWLYLLCSEKAEALLEEKQWNEAKTYFNKCAKYAGTDREFKNAQSGVSLAEKKKRR